MEVGDIDTVLSNAAHVVEGEIAVGGQVKENKFGIFWMYQKLQIKVIGSMLRL